MKTLIGAVEPEPRTLTYSSYSAAEMTTGTVDSVWTLTWWPRPQVPFVYVGESVVREIVIREDRP